MTDVIIKPPRAVGVISRDYTKRVRLWLRVSSVRVVVSTTRWDSGLPMKKEARHG